MAALSDKVISDELLVYGASAKAEVCSAIRAYIPLLLHWNRKISLTTVTDPLEILRFHFGESIFAASAFINQNGRLADVGSGAGFPGLPLKLLIPSLSVFLIESNAKRAAFLAEAVRELGIEGVEVYRGRFEELGFERPEFDFITARALGMHEKLVNWAKSAIKVGGSLILWLGQDDALQITMRKSWQWRKPLLIPGTRSRTILIGVAM
jgi:16S rRNA (guanine527-N7)-methyltransferase